ncbi:MAG: hypothetical protein NZ480_00110 [Bdellovibrionaceae bacterium]|nr:hypothetical protein [Pseudobdellovibrionaceae bacterium]
MKATQFRLTSAYVNIKNMKTNAKAYDQLTKKCDLNTESVGSDASSSLGGLIVGLVGLVFFLLQPISFTSAKESEVPSAVKKVQSELTNPTVRESIIRENPKAQEIDKSIQKLVGGNSNLSNQIYELSADMLEILMEKADHQPHKLQLLLYELQKNPAQFLTNMPPPQRKKFEQIVKQIEAQKPAIRHSERQP